MMAHQIATGQVNSHNGFVYRHSLSSDPQLNSVNFLQNLGGNLNLVGANNPVKEESKKTKESKKESNKDEKGEKKQKKGGKTKKGSSKNTNS